MHLEGGPFYSCAVFALLYNKMHGKAVLRGSAMKETLPGEGGFRESGVDEACLAVCIDLITILTIRTDSQ